MGVKRKQHSAEFKARVAMASLSGEKTLAALSAEFGVHPTMISNWKQELVKRAAELFARGSKAPAELELLKRLDRIFTDHPVYGSRRLQVALLREGISVGRRRVRRLMRKLGLWAVRPKRNTSKRHPGHKVYPYLLRGKTIDRANQVWAADITYIPMRQGILYLVAIIDWATRRVLSWRFCQRLRQL